MPGCRVLVRTAGYCDEHRKEAHRDYNARRAARGKDVDKLYRTAAWRRLRREVLQAEPLCRRCKSDDADDARAVPAVVVDHITPVKQGGSFWSKGNLQPLCNRCHEDKSHAEGSRFWKPAPRGARGASAVPVPQAADEPDRDRSADLEPTLDVELDIAPSPAPDDGADGYRGGRFHTPD